ncbi:calcium-binding EF-hand domain-containing protein [Heterostelium album PN500]|uniref:Calcium-binding EF-hand domain-containing protein n=1 Tax=Heterostelium pallidum (strain ATCC 26659 / Pp 5 / PN500) TaxID=670386 RepID=D3B0Q9_HETP5|nr:calcium-binding EF-hand domain-containing protein [Heterostelium album PN500]EFA84883.1 calcium-binding EF-hand domain-containing protein [Heterostelium album PN500]|eukprot:XP_020436994.1 calcium-binding EF-hand domain-containing protein [Heterostelium album PN500]
MNHINTKEQVIEAFKVFDREGQGYVTVDYLRKVLNELGDMMPADEYLNISEFLIFESTYMRKYIYKSFSKFCFEV